jgi:hypothetical protein
MDEYEALTGVEPVDLDALEREFDIMVERMQAPEQKTATDALFGMSGAELGRAAADVGEER